jgi:hypothetical protein
MIRVDVRMDISRFERKLSLLQRQRIPFATSLAVSNTAKDVKAELVKEMGRVFDAPTKFTLDSLYMKPGNKANPEAKVWVKDKAFKGRAAIEWLGPEIYGGVRTEKRGETLLRQRGHLPAGWYVRPANWALDQNGNIQKGLMAKILAALDANLDRSVVTKSKPLRKGGRRQKRKAEFFAAVPGQRKTAHLAPGVYQRTGFGFGSAIRPVLLFISRASYRKRLDFFGVAERTIKRQFRRRFKEALRQALGYQSGIGGEALATSLRVQRFRDTGR